MNENDEYYERIEQLLTPISILPTFSSLMECELLERKVKANVVFTYRLSIGLNLESAVLCQPIKNGEDI